MEIVDYTEKSLVIKGEKTREYKENLKELGGKFNASLKCGAGWIFPKTKKSELEVLIQKVNAGSLKPAESRFYRDQREPPKKEYSSYRETTPLDLDFKNKNIRSAHLLSGDKQQALSILINDMETEIDKLKGQVNYLKKMFLSDGKNNEEDEKREEEFEEVEEVVEVEEEEVEPSKRLLKNKI